MPRIAIVFKALFGQMIEGATVGERRAGCLQGAPAG
jgi:hypothetical protein